MIRSGSGKSRERIMRRILLTKELAFAAATDEANRQARKAGRKAWNSDDYNKAVETYAELIRQVDGRTTDQ